MINNSKYDAHARTIASELVTLLTLCQRLQSEKDGRVRPAPDVYSRDEDEFADRIRSACGHALQLRRLLPMMITLSAGEKSVCSRAKITQRRPSAG